MATLGLKGTRVELEKWIKEMQGMAGEGVAWKLDVVRTAGGLEFRGVVMPAGGEGPEGVKEGGGKKAEVAGDVEAGEGQGEGDEGGVGSVEEFV